MAHNGWIKFFTSNQALQDDIDRAIKSIAATHGLHYTGRLHAAYFVGNLLEDKLPAGTLVKMSPHHYRKWCRSGSDAQPHGNACALSPLTHNGKENVFLFQGSYERDGSLSGVLNFDSYKALAINLLHLASGRRTTLYYKKEALIIQGLSEAK